MSSCFFSQNLLSDYLENILPANRRTEMEGHLRSCKSCTESLEDLKKSLEHLRALPVEDLSNKMALQIVEAVEGKKRAKIAPSRAWPYAAAVSIPALVLVAYFAVSPQKAARVVPFLRGPASLDQTFTRYYPLHHGAEKILASQGSVIEMQRSFSGSLWEEGGLSPEEFEKAFQLKPSAKGEGS